MKYSLQIVCGGPIVFAMSTLQIDLSHNPVEAGPACTKCASRTRLVGIEPHPTKTHTDLRSYACMACESVQTAVVPLAN